MKIKGHILIKKLAHCKVIFTYVLSVRNKVTDNFIVQIPVRKPTENSCNAIINENLHHDDRSTCRDSRPHNCDESQGDGEVKLACGCTLQVVAGAF